jgi:hypothetical protein
VVWCTRPEQKPAHPPIRRPALSRVARAVTIGLTALVALALNRALAAYADGVAWSRAVPEDRITVASLAFIGAGIILHVGIGLRWPFQSRVTGS